MARLKLTDRFVDSVTVTERSEFWDTAKGSALVLRVTPASSRGTGKKTWSVVYRRKLDSKKQRVTIGKYPTLSLADARDAAMAVMRAVAAGGDPAGKLAAVREGETVEELGKAFIAEYAKPRLRSWAEVERIWKANVDPLIGKAKARAVSKRDVERILAAKVADGSPTMADRTLAVVRKAYGWAVQKRGYEVNPAAGLKVEEAPNTKRARVLTHEEIRQCWAVEGVIGDALRLLLLTGQRSSEVCGLVAGELDLEAATWTIPATRSKNGLAHAVALSDSTVGILKRRATGLKKGAPLFTLGEAPLDHRAVAKLVRGLQSGGDRFTPHDLRRTVATELGEMQVPPHVVEALLNHVSGHRAGVAGTYNRAVYLAERRAALLGWERKVLSIVGEKQRNVIPFSAA